MRKLLTLTVLAFFLSVQSQAAMAQGNSGNAGSGNSASENSNAGGNGNGGGSGNSGGNGNGSSNGNSGGNGSSNSGGNGGGSGGPGGNGNGGSSQPDAPGPSSESPGRSDEAPSLAPETLPRSSERTALEATRSGEAVPLENLLPQVRQRTSADVIDAELVTVNGTLVYAIKIVTPQGSVRTEYFYARNGQPLGSR